MIPVFDTTHFFFVNFRTFIVVEFACFQRIFV
jgi:hypothetical protein